MTLLLTFGLHRS